jgi:hypothetical protein
MVLEYSGPCLICRAGDDRFSINPSSQLFHCRVCMGGGRGPIDLEMFLTGVDFTIAVRQLTGTDIPADLRGNTVEAAADDKPRRQEQADYEAKQHAMAAWLWRMHRPAAGSLVQTYLHARGYHLLIPPTIGFLPASGKYPPSMITAFALPNIDRPGVLGPPQDVRSVNITTLLPDGSDRVRTLGAKKIIGRVLARPLVMAAIGNNSILCITEGIESALAFAAAGFGSWAAGSAPHMAALAQTIPEHIERLVIEQHDERQGVRPGRLDIQLFGDQS